MMTLSDLRGLPHISISQLKTYVQCPKKYFLQYIARSEPSHRAIALAFETAWHQTISEHLLPQVDGQYLSREALHALFRDTLTEEVNSDGVPVLFEDDDPRYYNPDFALTLPAAQENVTSEMVDRAEETCKEFGHNFIVELAVAILIAIVLHFVLHLGG